MRLHARGIHPGMHGFLRQGGRLKRPDDRGPARRPTCGDRTEQAERRNDGDG